MALLGPEEVMEGRTKVPDGHPTAIVIFDAGTLGFSFRLGSPALIEINGPQLGMGRGQQ